ncbi:MAG: MaoC/PaaZ C-terminal domain-containing protein [Myxococcales bacterium]
MAEAVTLTFAELTEGVRVVAPLCIDAGQMQRFAELSGDFNPLHTDDAFARRKGFDGQVVYGALLIAKISELIGMRLPGKNSVWASLSVDFLKPLYVDQSAELEAVVARTSTGTGLVELGLTLRRGDKRLLKGRAEVIVVE